MTVRRRRSTRRFGWQHAAKLTAYLAHELTRRARPRTREAGWQVRDVPRIAEEQAALRRVATLVARAAPPEEVFSAVTAEVGQLLDADFIAMMRYDASGAGTVVGTWTSTGAAGPISVGDRLEPGGRNLLTEVGETRRPARIDDYADAFGGAAEKARAWGARCAVGVPINVESRLWGLMIAVSTSAEPLRADTEAQLAGFTELVATAIANAQAHLELRGFAEEQAALRRVATLVAGAAVPEEVFAAVTAEVGRVLHVGFTSMIRYDPDGAMTWVGTWSDSGVASPIPVGTRARPGGRNVPTLVLETGRPARVDHPDGSGEIADIADTMGVYSSVGVPIHVADRLWGVMGAVNTHGEPLPADTEARLAGFTELVATALSNAEAQAQLTASRARIMAAADDARRRIERDLHDGAQQRLVSLALQLQAAQEAVPPEADELAEHLDSLITEVTSTLDELRELARGIHPAILAEGGLYPALRTLARRCTVPVELDMRADGRLPEPVETATYYLVAESLTNAAKHAAASIVQVEVGVTPHDACDVLRVRVRDDGRGGAHFIEGAGLVGLKDRAEALGGRLRVHTAPGAGTTVLAELPLRAIID